MDLEAFYGGAVGGGKSDALLMSALQFVDVPGYNAILIRENYQVLSLPGGLMDRAFEWLTPTDAHWNDKNKRWIFPSGATLSFGYLDGPRDHFRYQSSEFQFVGIDECVNIREKQALYMFSRLRKLETSPVPIRFRCASNPPAREQYERGKWVKERYIHSNRIFIPAWMDDNKFLNKVEYEKSLNNLDPITREQLKKGDWDIQISGNFFKREWFPIVDKDKAPSLEDCRVVRYWDFASTDAEPGKDPAFTSGCKMAYHEPTQKYYIWNINRFQKSSAKKEAIVRQTADIDTADIPIYIEQEPGSSGKDVISHYQRNILPEFAVEGDTVSGKGSKTKRATPLASAGERGDVLLVRGHWNENFLEELELFPDGSYKDQVDSASGAYNKLAINNSIVRIRTV